MICQVKLLGFQLSFRDDLCSMVIQTVDDWSSWLKVHIHGGSLRFLGKATFRLKISMIEEINLMNDENFYKSDIYYILTLR